MQLSACCAALACSSVNSRRARRIGYFASLIAKTRRSRTAEAALDGARTDSRTFAMSCGTSKCLAQTVFAGLGDISWVIGVNFLPRTGISALLPTHPFPLQLQRPLIFG